MTHSAIPSLALAAAFATSAQADSPALFAEMANASHVRLLPGSPFYDRQELHRSGHSSCVRVRHSLIR